MKNYIVVIMLCISTQLGCSAGDPTKLSAKEINLIVLYLSHGSDKTPDVHITDSISINRIMTKVNSLKSTDRQVNARQAFKIQRLMFYTKSESTFLSVIYMSKDDVVLRWNGINYHDNGLAQLINEYKIKD